MSMFNKKSKKYAEEMSQKNRNSLVSPRNSLSKTMASTMASPSTPGSQSSTRRTIRDLHDGSLVGNQEDFQMIDPSREGSLIQKKKNWAEKIYHWTQKHRKGYIQLKVLQMAIAAIILVVGWFQFSRSHEQNKNASQPMLPIFIIIIGQAITDCFIFLLDFLMICRRPDCLIKIRFFSCFLSILLEISVQALFWLSIEDGENKEMKDAVQQGSVSLDVVNKLSGDSIWVIVCIVYYYSSLIFGIIMNVSIYCQIVADERKEKKYNKQMAKKLLQNQQKELNITNKDEKKLDQLTLSKDIKQNTKKKL